MSKLRVACYGNIDKKSFFHPLSGFAFLDGIKNRPNPFSNDRFFHSLTGSVKSLDLFEILFTNDETCVHVRLSDNDRHVLITFGIT